MAQGRQTADDPAGRWWGWQTEQHKRLKAVLAYGQEQHWAAEDLWHQHRDTPWKWQGNERWLLAIGLAPHVFHLNLTGFRRYTIGRSRLGAPRLKRRPEASQRKTANPRKHQGHLVDRWRTAMTVKAHKNAGGCGSVGEGKDTVAERVRPWNLALMFPTGWILLLWRSLNFLSSGIMRLKFQFQLMTK